MTSKQIFVQKSVHKLFFLCAKLRGLVKNVPQNVPQNVLQNVPQKGGVNDLLNALPSK